MAVFGYWHSTSSDQYMDANGTWIDQNTWGWTNQNSLRYITEPILSVLEVARTALARTKSVTVATPIVGLISGMPQPVFAPRRVVIERGIVNWVRAGTRRPLRGRGIA